jgi:hypothetical protein
MLFPPMNVNISSLLYIIVLILSIECVVVCVCGGGICCLGGSDDIVRC